MAIKKLIKYIANSLDINISRKNKYVDDPRLKLFNSLSIDLVLDVGANCGQYAISIRSMGFEGRINSFEPLGSAFEKLKFNSQSDCKWVVHNYALGDENGFLMINESRNNVSSSILNILPSHISSAPESIYFRKEKIVVKTLDSIYHDICQGSSGVLLKIDTQGYENKVLAGASSVLETISLIQLEMSLIPLYESEMSYIDMIKYLQVLGFQLVYLENGFEDTNTGQLLQVDGWFVRKSLLVEGKIK